MFPGATTGPAGHDGNKHARGTPHGALRFASALALVALALNTVGGCGSNKNYEQREAFAATLPDDGKASIWDDDAEGCIGQCQRDPGSPLMDCAAEEEGLEFLPLEGWDFRKDGVATGQYQYTDGSAHNLRPRGWEPPTAPMARCLGVTDNYGFRLRGGPYRDWGGGFGARLFYVLTAGNCGADDPNYRADYCQSLDADPVIVENTFNLTQWDGISFWARRGPDGQPLLRVMIADQRTDDDISFLMYEADPAKPRFCERNKDCGCPRGLPCTVVPEDQREEVNNNCAREQSSRHIMPIMVCWDPEKGPLSQMNPHQACGPYACMCPYEAFATPEGQSGVFRPDPAFDQRGCNEFAFRGGIVDNYCYDPGQDPNPYEANYLCGDHWAAPVHLTTDWQFFKVPFTSLLQQGWAKEQHQFDLHAVSMIRFTWDKGNIDYFIDDVRFYREKRSE